MSHQYQYFKGYVILKLKGEEKYFGLQDPSIDFDLMEGKDEALIHNLIMTPKLNNIALVCEHINNRSFYRWCFNLGSKNIDPKVVQAAILYIQYWIDKRINYLSHKINKMKEFKKTLPLFNFYMNKGEYAKNI